MTKDYTISVDRCPTAEHLQVLEEKIVNFNKKFFGERKLFAVLLKDSKGIIVGGISAYIWPDLGQLYIAVLYLPEDLRKQGYGSRLMNTAEDEGRRQGCTYVQLDTFSFQAEGFYRKLGYARIGFVEKHYGEYDHIFMRKSL